MIRIPIRYKLLSLIFIIAIPVSFISIHHYHGMVEEAKNDVQFHNLQLANNIAGDLNLIVERSFAALKAVARHPAVIAKDPRTCDRLFREMLPSFPSHLNIIAVDMNGNSYGSAVAPWQLRALHGQDREWFRRAARGVTVIGNLQISGLFNSPSIMLAQPVIDKGRQVAVLGMALDVKKVRANLARWWELPADSTINILDEAGNVVICICEHEVGGEQTVTCPTVRLTSTNYDNLEETGSDGVRRLFSFASVPNTKWKVLIGVPVESASRQASRSARHFLLVIAAGTLAAIILALLISGQISRNISAVVTGMKAVEQGNLAVQVSTSGNDELALVARSFNRMVTQRMHDEQRVRHSQSFLASVLDGIGEGVVVIDRDYRIVSVNQGYCRQVKLHHDQAVGKHCYEISHQRKTPCFTGDDGCECAVFRCFETGEPRRAVHVHRNSEGRASYLEVRAYPLRDAAGYVASAIETLTDITERRSLEAQLFQAQKMEAVGLLAGGVAHDFNNILTAIIGYGNLLKGRAESDAISADYTDQILASADRASHLTRSLLAFSRSQIIDPRPIRLNEIIKRIEPLLRRLTGEDVELFFALTKEEGTIWADPHQMEQVLMNLCTNARDAMPAGGKLSISTERVVTGDFFCLRHPGARSGACMRLSVADSGVGMNEATQEKMFEPFFTTKESGKGTGLGLSIIYGIVKQHNGFIDVRSEVAKGTIFIIHFPIIHEQAENLKAQLHVSAGKGSETILLAEDDENVRLLAENILQEHGYRVITAADGQEAVEKFGRHADAVDLVVLDVLMPKKNGKEAYDELKKFRSPIKVIFMSGYAPETIHQKGIIDTGNGFLHKPFSPAAFLSKVREVLDT